LVNEAFLNLTRSNATQRLGIYGCILAHPSSFNASYWKYFTGQYFELISRAESYGEYMIATMRTACDNDTALAFMATQSNIIDKATLLSTYLNDTSNDTKK